MGAEAAVLIFIFFVIVIIGLGVGAYFLFFKKSSSTSTGTSPPGGTVASGPCPSGQIYISALQQCVPTGPPKGKGGPVSKGTATTCNVIPASIEFNLTGIYWTYNHADQVNSAYAYAYILVNTAASPTQIVSVAFNTSNNTVATPPAGAYLLATWGVAGGGYSSPCLATFSVTANVSGVSSSTIANTVVKGFSSCSMSPPAASVSSNVLSWTAVTDATSYMFMVSNAPFPTAATPSVTTPSSPGQLVVPFMSTTNTSFALPPLNSGTTYYFFVLAIGSTTASSPTIGAFVA